MNPAPLDPTELAARLAGTHRDDADVRTAIDAVARGGFTVITGSDDENYGVLAMAAQTASTDRVAFLVRHTSGMVCAPMADRRLDELAIPMITPAGSAAGPRIAQSVSYRNGSDAGPGVGAADRAATIRALAGADTTRSDFVRPGHVVPLRARPGGVLTTPTMIEAGVDIALLADRAAAAATAELVNDDGSVCSAEQAALFAARHDLPTVAIPDLVAYRRRHEQLVELVADTRLPTRWGTFRCRAYRSIPDGNEALAIIAGDVSDAPDVLVRPHSECLTGDVLGSRRCDCGDQLHGALQMIGECGRGAVIYLLGHEGRGIGLVNKLRAYALQDSGADTVEANVRLGLPVDARSYHVAAQIIRDLGIGSVRLITNNPDKVYGLIELGVPVVGRVASRSTPRRENAAYLETKQLRMGHLLPPRGSRVADGAGARSHAS